MFTSFFFFSSRRRHTRCSRDWSSDVCSSDLWRAWRSSRSLHSRPTRCSRVRLLRGLRARYTSSATCLRHKSSAGASDRKSTRLNSSHGYISYAVFCLKKKKKKNIKQELNERQETNRQTQDDV